MSKIIVFTALFCSGIYNTHTYAQSADNVLKHGYYTVIATYRLGQDNYVHRYINDLSNKGLHPQYGADPDKKYLYVYLGYYTDFKMSITAMRKLRNTGEFITAWVRAIGYKYGENFSSDLQYANYDTTTHSQANGDISDNSITANDREDGETMQKKDTKPKGELSQDKQLTRDGVIKKIKPRDTVHLVLSIDDSDTIVEGEIKVVDTDRSRHIKRIAANTYTLLPDPKSKSGRLTLKVNIFGYKPCQVNVNFRLTPADTLQSFITRQGDYYFIKFDLIKYKKGDMYAMDNVYFYNNATIMLPGSRPQLNRLLHMMNGNPHYTIKLHGHTNGKVAGKLITMGPSNLFFLMSDDIKESFGSAKRLSKERALTIKKWLIKQGVAPNRMKIKAWGGNKMLYDQNRSNADKNVRVEVEILTQ